MRLRAWLAVMPALLAAGIATATSPVHRQPQPRAVAHSAPAVAARLGNAGRWIVDRRGRVVIAHGFNLVDKVAPYEPAAGGFGASDARFLQHHGFNAVRLGVIPEAVEPRPGHFDAGYLRSIRRTERLLARHGIRSLLDFHQDLYNERFQGEGLPAWMIDDDGLPIAPKAGFPGNYFVMPALQRAFENLWANAPGPGGVGIGTRYIELVRHVAHFFHGVPGVLGYDVFNEPFPGSNYLACFPPVGCPGVDRGTLQPFMARAIRAVHRGDPGRLAFFEPWITFDYGAPTGIDKLPAGPVGMSFHDYCFGAIGVSTPVTQQVCNDLDESRVVANAIAEARRTGNALLLSEFGSETDTTDLREIVDLADAHSISWLEWAYCACGDPTGGGQAESLVLDANRPPRGANVNHTTLGALDEPYPQLVSGTPEHPSFDPATKVFTLAYSTHSPTGSHFRAGARTRIWIPRLQYRHGYRVTVHGGQVVSGRTASHLVIAQRHRAKSITVTVRPRS